MAGSLTATLIQSITIVAGLGLLYGLYKILSTVVSNLLDRRAIEKAGDTLARKRAARFLCFILLECDARILKEGRKVKVNFLPSLTFLPSFIFVRRGAAAAAAAGCRLRQLF